MLEKPNLKNKPNDFHTYSDLLHKEENYYFDILEKKKPWPFQDKLAQKVCDDKSIIPYFGDTIVFKLDADQIKIFENMQKQFRKHVTQLSTPLIPETFHMTLHDMSNGPTADILETESKKNIPLVQAEFEKIAQIIKKNPSLKKISFDFSKLYPSHFIVSTASMIPSTTRDFNILMNLYGSFDKILYLKENLFPHITLDYWSLDAKDSDKKNIIKAFNEINSEKFTIELDLYDITYQSFTSMNDYNDIFTIKDFI